MLPLFCHGEGQDCGTRACKEGDGGGKRQETEPRVVIARGAAAGLDLGRLDPVFDLARRSGRAGGVWTDRQGSGKAAGGGYGTPASTG